MGWMLRFRSWMQNPTPRTDAVLAVAITVAMLVGTTFGEFPDDRPVDVWGLLLIAIAGAAVFFRRTHSIPALVTATALGFAYWILDYPNAGAAGAILVLLYSAALYTPDRVVAMRVLIGFTVAIVIVLVAGYLSPDEDEVTLGLIVLNMIMFQLAWLAGDSVRNRRTQIASLHEQVEMAETAQAEQTARAVDDERNRIARELHDVVAHSMSVIVVQAEGAARMVGRNDDAVRTALAAIEQASRVNLNDIRGIVGILREDVDLAPAPELRMVDTLVDHCAEAGLVVSLAVVGERRPLPAMIELSGYRIVQESLTNTLKHAGPQARASVTIDYRADEVEIAVIDDGRGAAANMTSTPGHGLLGMRERVEAFGGELRTGPRSGGGYEVTATLPVANR
ncbi:MAG: sensor histidine kinase [Acidimicrobiales bacterium]